MFEIDNASNRPRISVLFHLGSKTVSLLFLKTITRSLGLIPMVIPLRCLIHAEDCVIMGLCYLRVVAIQI